MLPANAKFAVPLATLATEKRGLRKNLSSSIGCAHRNSHSTRQPMSTIAIGEGAQRRRRAPALARRLDRRPHQRRHAHDREHDAQRVELRRARVPRLRDRPPRDRQHHHDERHVHQEHRSPPEPREQQPAEHRPEGDPQAGERGPHAECTPTLAGIGEDVGQDRDRGRHDQRGAESHDPAADGERDRSRARTQPPPTRSRTPRARCAGSGRDRSDPRGCHRRAGSPRTRGCRRRRSTATPTSWRRDRARGSATRRSGSGCRSR